VTVVFEPGFEPRRFLFEKTSFRNTARQKAEAFGFGFDECGVF